jgi:hypothetical protein
VLAVLTLLVNGCNSGDPFLQSPPASFSIVSVSPAENQVAVSPGSTVQVTFEKDIDERSLNLSNFKLSTKSGTTVGSKILWQAVTRTATLTPLFPLKQNTVYEITVSGVRGLSGEFIPPHRFEFTTATEMIINRINPRNGDQGVQIQGPGVQEIFAIFNQSVNTATLTKQNFFAIEQSQNEQVFPGFLDASINYDDSLKKLSLRPNLGRLRFSTTYSVTLRDIPSLNNAFSKPRTWEFRTEEVRVTAALPSNGSSSVSTRTPIEVFFQSPVDRATISGNIKLRKAFGQQEEFFFKGEPVFDLNDSKVIFQTSLSQGDQGLDSNTRYEVLVTGVETVNQERFQSFRSFFTTGP